MAWIINENGLTNDAFPAMPEHPLAPEYPFLLWRVKASDNGGYPYFKLHPEIPPIVHPVPQNDYICIYDMDTEKEEFIGNGLAILLPTQCVVTEVLNGEYSLKMTHPIDREGRWQYIQERNIVKALGQLFTIMQVQWNWTGQDAGTVTVYAEHIFYQLADPWIFPFEGESYISSKYADTIIRAAESGMYYHAEPGQHNYAFDWTSDMVFETPYLYENKNGRTFIDVIMGSDGILAVKGGEIHRDNFYFSVKERKETAKDDAFDIRIGANLAGITRTVDISTFCSYFRAYDNFGGWYAWAWHPSEFILRNFSHHIIRSANFSFSEESYDFEMLGQYAMAEFRKNCMPIITYEIDLANIHRNPEYAEHKPDYEYKVGNKGRLYDNRFGGSIELSITETQTDAITGDILSITIGTTRSFTRASSYPAIVTFDPEPQGSAFPLRDKDGVFLYDVNDVQIVEVEDYG